MDETTSSRPPDVTSGAAALSFPTGDSATLSSPTTSARNDAGCTRFGDPADAAPGADDLVNRARQGAHDAVDDVAAKLSSAAQGLQRGVSKADDARAAWLESAREAIRQHPFAVVAGALLIGAAASSLASSRGH